MSGRLCICDAVRLFLPEVRRRGSHAHSLSELLARDAPDTETQELPKGSGGCNASRKR